LSMDYRPGADFGRAAALAHALAHAIQVEGLPPQTLLNVNIPGAGAKAEASGNGDAGAGERYAWTRLGQRLYRDLVESRTNPRGQTYFWIGGPPEFGDNPPGTDLHAVQHGIASVTPLGLDLTHQGLLAQLPRWRLHGFEAVLAGEHQSRVGQPAQG